MRSSIFVLVFLAALLGMPTGCGGGGGAPPGPTTDVFLGTYGIHQFKGDFGPPLTASAFWGTMAADGMGSITGGSTTSITNGVLGPTMPSGATPYTLQPGNRLLWLFGSLALADGGISADGSLGTMGVVFPGSGASVVHFARRGTGYSLASLNGTYHYAQFLAGPTGGSDGSFWGAVTFNGAGAAAYSVWANIDGVISGPAALVGTYTVAPDGALLMSIGATAYSGSVARGGDIGLFSGSTGAGGVAGLGVFIKHSTAAANATFTGSYHMTLLAASSALLPPTNWRAATGTLSADGAGQFVETSETLMDDQGVITPVPGPFVPSPYAVAANGGMTVATGLVGAISSDGSVVAFVGATLPGSGMLLWLMIR